MSIERKLHQARPGLRLYNPIVFWICWGYAVVNIILGLGMIFLYHTPIDLAIASLLSYPAWGGLFLLTAVVGAYSLITNNWNLCRKALILGIILKSIWGIALVVRCLEAPQTILITAVWFFFTYIQTLTYVFFYPPIGVRDER